MRPSDDEYDRIVRERAGHLYISVAHCASCNRVMLAPGPTQDMCNCGSELYPVSKWVPLGEAVSLDDMKGW